MPEYAHVVAPIIVVLMMMVVGLELTLADLRHELRRPRVIGCAFVVQLTLLPAFTYALGRALELPVAVVVGMAVLAACPAGGISNAFVQAARGNLPLSVSMTGLGAVAAPLTVPILLAIGLGAGMGIGGQAPLGAVRIAGLAFQLTFAIIAPIALGMAVRHLRPAWAERNRRRLSGLATAGIVAFVAASLATNFDDVVAALSNAMLPGLLWTLGAATFGLALGWLLGLAARDLLTLVIEFVNRNLGIALVVAMGFPDPGAIYMFPTAVIAFGYPGSLLAGVWFRRRPPRRAVAPVP
jgi:BASS family bile acid:Na+ symporter